MTTKTAPPPATIPIDDQLAELLVYYATFAPSSHNTQPWHFEWTGDQLRVYADLTRWLPVADADRRELSISAGCALENLQLAAQMFRYRSTFTYFPDPNRLDWVATVRLTKDSARHGEESIDLFAHVMSRRTYHHAYREQPVEESVLSQLHHWTYPEDVGLCLMNDKKDRLRIEDLVVQADTLQFSDPAYREELGYWIGQGVFGTAWLIAKMGQWVVTHFNSGAQQSRKDASLVRQAPLLGILYTESNTRIDQVKVGRAYQHLGLGCATLGLGLQPLSQPLEVEELKPQLAQLLPYPDHYPQHLFRLGYTDQEQTPTPRRPAHEFFSR